MVVLTRIFERAQFSKNVSDVSSNELEGTLSVHASKLGKFLCPVDCVGICVGHICPGKIFIGGNCPG